MFLVDDFIGFFNSLDDVENFENIIDNLMILKLIQRTNWSMELLKMIFVMKFIQFF